MIIRRTVFASCLSLLCAAPLASAQTVEHGDVAPMISAINAERARASLPPLAEDPRLDAIAESHSMDMARARFFSHASPTTGQPAERVTRAGLSWTSVAENIAINQSPEAAQAALLRSPGHHENMVDPAQRSVGVGIVRHGDQVWVTQLFAALNHPLAAQPVASPAPPVASPSASAPIREPDEDSDADADADEATDADDDQGDDPAAAAPVPAAPTAPFGSMLSGLPTQGIPGLDQFLTGLGLTRQASPAPRAGAVSRAPQVYTVQTPFGPVRVEVPGSFAAPAAAPAAAPTAAPRRSARPSRAPRVRPPAAPRGRVVQIDTLDV